MLAAFLFVSWWVFFRKGLASATYEAFDKPGLLLLVVLVTILSAGFHEFGHAAGARRGGATPGVMGAGVYLVWPAFYTDVTDSYRLGRGGRVRTDLGGLYFNAIVAVGIAGIWWATGYDALLLVVATQILQMVRQLTPLVRFDGYHVLADVTGVPDLFHRIKPTLLGVLPWRWKHPESTVLKPWARIVVTLWVLVVVPMLAFSMFTMVVTLPRILGTAWASLGKQSTLLGRAWGDADFLEVAARAVAILAVTFPILATAVILTRLVRSVVRSVLARTQGKPLRRGVAGLVAAALVAGLAWAWWPHPDTYRPIQPYEGGTLRQVAQALPAAVRPPPSGLVEGQRGTLVTGWADGGRTPHPRAPAARDGAGPPWTPTVRDRRRLDRRGRRGPGHRRCPHHRGHDLPGARRPAHGAPAGCGGPDDPAPQSWVFPFNKPLAPGEGDNQSMAVNTTDNTVQYDVAFALVWIDDDSPAMNTNEAYAFASCTNCAAVAVGFQIVLVTGDNHVAVPQNISAAVNSDCVNCLTYALATQLFVTLDGPLSEAGTQQISALWQEIASFGTHITEVPLSEIRSRLTAYETQIVAIIEKEQGPLAGTPTAAPTAAPRPRRGHRGGPQQRGHSAGPRVADRERPCGVGERRAGRSAPATPPPVRRPGRRPRPRPRRRTPARRRRQTRPRTPRPRPPHRPTRRRRPSDRVSACAPWSGSRCSSAARAPRRTPPCRSSSGAAGRPWSTTRWAPG